MATNNNESYKYKFSQLSGGNDVSNVLLSTYVDNSFTSTDSTNGVYCVKINDSNGFSYVNLYPIQGGLNITSGNTNLVQGKAVYEYAAPKSHTHTISNVSGLQTALDGKLKEGNPALAKSEWKENADGSWTYVAYLVRRGTVICIR